MIKTAHKKTEGRFKAEWVYDLSHTALWRESPVDFEVGEETVFHCKRRVIKYKDGFSNTSHKALGPDIDAISFLSFITNTKAYNLFCSLEEAQITSPLIKHFAEQERCSANYTDPDTGLILWKRRTVLQKSPSEIVKAEESEYEGAPFEVSNSAYYWLNGGFDSFLLMLEKDPDFFNCLIKGVERGICKLSRLDLCVDFSENLMAYVKSSIEKGYYECKGLHPYGFGWLGGKRMAGPVGRGSKYAERFKEELLLLNSVYFGDQKRNDKVVFFYDKGEESFKRSDSRWPSSTRIETRLYGRKEENIPIMIEALSSYNDPNDGWKVRMKLFVEILTSVVRFTTRKRVRAVERNAAGVLAPWWIALITTLLHTSLEEGEIKQMKSLGCSISEPELHSLLHESIKSKNRSALLKRAEDYPKNSFERFKVLAEISCDSMDYRTFYRKHNLQRYLKQAERHKIKDIFEKKTNK